MDLGNDDRDYQPRTDSRIITDDVRCSVGRVVNLSGSGMRLLVQSNQVPTVGETQDYSFTQTNQELCISGIVRWVRKGSALSRRSEIGIEFVNVPVHQRDALIRLAVHGEFSSSPDSQPSVQIQNPDLYAILGVSPHASATEIGRTFRQMVKKWHPDNCASPNAEARIIELHKAYSVLRDPQRRARYDERFGPDQSAA